MRRDLSDAERDERRQRMREADRASWRRMTTSDGRYDLVLVPRDYPYPDSVSTRGFMREHRMVMELHLGRALGEAEVVHHLNHNTHDNSVENLAIYDSHSKHMEEEWSTRDVFHSRWPACVCCGRGTKPHAGGRWTACKSCRQLVRHRNDPRIVWEEWPKG